MTQWMLALKRMLRPGTILMLTILMLAVWAGGMAGHQASLRPCGIVCEDSDPHAAEVQRALEEKGFVPFDTRNQMEEAVSRGKLDCGAVLLPGLGQSVAVGNPGGHVLLLTAPDSFLTEAYEAHLASTLYAASAPALTLQSASEAGVSLPPEAVRMRLEAMQAEGSSFTFEILTIEGAPRQVPDLGRAVRLAAAALLLFAAIVPGTIRAVEEMDRLWGRIGRRAAVMGILLPTLFWQTVLYTLAAGLVLRENGLVLAGYVLLLTALGLIAARMPFQLGVLLPLCLLGSLAMLPIYYDLAAFYPRLAVLQFVLPPCWLPKLLACPQAAALGVVTIPILIFYPQRRQL